LFGESLRLEYCLVCDTYLLVSSTPFFSPNGKQIALLCTMAVILIKCWLVAEDMQQAAIDTASVAMEKYTTEKEIAAYIKKEFDKKYDPTWHCIVGRSFGSYVTHESRNFILFYLNQFGILLLKAG
jgi:dynein light chain LC8-type